MRAQLTAFTDVTLAAAIIFIFISLHLRRCSRSRLGRCRPPRSARRALSLTPSRGHRSPSPVALSILATPHHHHINNCSAQRLRICTASARSTQVSSTPASTQYSIRALAHHLLSGVGSRRWRGTLCLPLRMGVTASPHFRQARWPIQFRQLTKPEGFVNLTERIRVTGDPESAASRTLTRPYLPQSL